MSGQDKLCEKNRTSGLAQSCGEQPRPSLSVDTNKTLASQKLSDKSVYDSRLSDSGVWSGSNIQSEEINTPESPISKSSDYSFVSDKFASDNKSYMRLDSGIDVSVSQNFSELSLKDADCCEKQNDLSTKPKVLTTVCSNINKPSATHPQRTAALSHTNPALLDKCFKQNEDGDTELHLAIIHKFIEPVYALVRMVPNPRYLNIRNDDKQSALHLAVLTRQHRLVRLLVCAGVQLDTLDRYGNTALHLAVQGDDLACVRAIIDPITSPEVMSYQLQYSPFSFHAHTDVANIHNYEGQTCVHLAALNGNIEILRYLLWYGADINAKEWKGGKTSLHLAVEQRDLALCSFLLREQRVDAEEMSYAGHTAYQLASLGWDAQITQVLCDHGVDTYVSEEEDSDDEMADVSESFNNNFNINNNGGGLVNVGA